MKRQHVSGYYRRVRGHARTIPTNRAKLDLSKPFFLGPLYPGQPDLPQVELAGELRGLLRTLTH